MVNDRMTPLTSTQKKSRVVVERIAGWNQDREIVRLDHAMSGIFLDLSCWMS